MTFCSPAANATEIDAVESGAWIASATYERRTVAEAVETLQRTTSVVNAEVSTTTGSVRPGGPQMSSSLSAGTKEPSEVIWSRIVA